MPDQITTTGSGANGTFNVYYGAENRQKRIAWVSGSCTVNKLYSALQNLFDELGQMDDGVPMSAQTPTEYTIGIIDAGDKDPWFIDRTTVEKLTGGAVKTASWARSLPGDGTGNVGIVRIAYTETVALVPGDIGKDVLMTVDGDRGTLLDYNATGTTKYMWIRPDDNTLANDFNNAPTANGAWTIVGGGTGTGNQAGGVAVTGESLWANIFTIGTIESNTHIYVNQNALTAGEEGELLLGYKSTSDWWGDGHIDILVNVQEVGNEIDEAVLQVFARQHTKTFDHYELADLSGGGRNPVPLSTGNDLDNQVGYRSLLMSGDSGNFSVGNRISHDATNPHGVIITVTGSSPTRTLQYYLIGDPLLDFVSTNTVTNLDDTGTGTVNGAPSNVNAALWTDVTIAFGSYARDINENDTNENYSILVNCGSRTSLQQVYRRLKYITRRGDASDIFGSEGQLQGQFYIGSDRRITYQAFSTPGSFTEGELISGGTSGAEGGVVADHNSGATGYVILRNTRKGGASNNVDFTVGETITGGTSGETATISTGGIVTITTPKAAPFGTFAGGKFFGAPGVVLDGVPTADASNFQLIDDTGTVINPPTKVVITISNTRQGDKVVAFRLVAAGGEIDKNKYTIAGTPAIGDATLSVSASIATDEPGKAAPGGVLRVVDVNADPTLTKEYRIRYASWSATAFTLANIDIAAADAGTDTDTIVEAGAFTNAKVGDIVVNNGNGHNGISYVTEVTSANEVQISPAITGQTTGDHIELNAVPAAFTAGTDKLYVPIVDSYETTTADPPSDSSETATITYVADIPIRVRARKSNNLFSTGPIIPFEQDSAVKSPAGATISVIRTPDTIFTP